MHAEQFNHHRWADADSHSHSYTTAVRAFRGCDVGSKPLQQFARLQGLPESSEWRAVQFDFRDAGHQHVTIRGHHCVFRAAILLRGYEHRRERIRERALI